ncbi:UBP1-associated protein 2A-like [Lycium barbarum]|uniref:UBP1-associated protein 2A-like n=1 Tax=Lycium barbarum TaxID=112863 RepID=UPI00293E332B|nr:UBP1-associated protein 2A-like [Lycium barbarum]XP_060197065.1 UBP1-associated protein 2A-like [Lycium barbarum]XP_060197066.1 UBP1-associated protein 2A-like [Lycium barbarum]XP_060197067.1 UBP1-associated protein 2A-like [Lycium barbarum]XP_060197068.1 UBP1-associated protein 2A-like [Lycium barbarum]
MAKKRKTRASESTQSVEDIKQEPDVVEEPEPEAAHEEEVEYEEEEEETVQEEDEEEPDPEDEDNDDEEEETPGSGNDAVKSVNDQQQLNGGDEVKKEGDEEDLEDEPLEKLLEPFTKDQLTALIKEALAKYPDFKENIQKLADKDPAHRKIFVHGLGWDTTAETLTSVFGKYGEIEDCKAVTDKVSGKSKGYGFILFKHRSGARKALIEPQKKIGTRMTSCQLASAGPVPAPPPTAAAPSVSEYTQRKIFVSNVAADLDPQKLLEFFSKFGEVEEGPLGLDKQTGKPKGFCLFVYKSVESARKALEEPHKSFEGHTLHCQKAVDGPKHNKNYYQQHQPQSQQHYPQHHHQQQYYQHPAKKGKYSGGSGSAGGSTGHLMAPSGPAPVGYNPAVAAVTPALGQALTALLATQGANLGIGNLLGGLGGPVNPQGVPPAMNNATGYGAQGAVGGYGAQPGMQYQNPQMQGGARPQGGGAPYSGYGGH